MKHNVLLFTFVLMIIFVPGQSYGQSFLEKVANAIEKLDTRNPLNQRQKESDNHQEAREDNYSSEQDYSSEYNSEDQKVRVPHAPEIEKEDGYVNSCALELRAKGNDEVALVESGRGRTHEEGINDALRKAVKEAFAKFVSANTSIIDGNTSENSLGAINSYIRDYNDLGSLQLSDGTIEVNVKAVVSIPKLVEYAKSKGASAELAGASFARKIQIMELEKQNEIAMLDTLSKEVKVLLPYCFKRKLTFEDPSLVRSEPDRDPFYGTETVNNWINEYYFTRMGPLDLTAKENQRKQALTTKITNYFKNASSCYLIKGKIEYQPTSQYAQLKKIILNTLLALSLSMDECNQYQNMKADIASFDVEGPLVGYCNVEFGGGASVLRFYLRSSEAVEKWIVNFAHTYELYIMGFALKDNNGTISRFKSLDVFSPIYVGSEYYRSDMRSYMKHRNYKNVPTFISVRYSHVDESNGVTVGEGLFSPFVDVTVNNNIYFKCSNSGNAYYTPGFYALMDKTFHEGMEQEEYPTTVTIAFLIPKDSIAKYSTFDIVDY